MKSTSTKALLEDYRSRMQKIADLKFSSAVLQWDQETYLPPKGAEFRGQQIATLTELAHQFFTDKELGSLLEEVVNRNDLTVAEKRNFELTREDFIKQQKFTPAFVRRLSEATHRSFHNWIKARKENNFRFFADDLDTLVTLKIEEAELLGYEGHPYNALLNDHDKGATVDLLSKTFTSIKEPLKDLLKKIQQAEPINDSFLKQNYPKDNQWQFGLQVIKDMGYDMEAGRQDIAEHPFTISFSSNDVRVTTRIDENDLSNMVWSCIHEAGHALYEQGLPADQYGLPLGEAASFSIHESQSRLWENHVGRSLSWCKYYLPILQKEFPKQLGAVSLEDFYRGINKVHPSFIRTEADELTYHFHVMIRYEIEKALLTKEIKAIDVPAYWNEKYFEYMNISVPDDKTGCLQDVHWSHGSFGYFPTYSLGSFYAAQFYRKAIIDHPSIDMEIKNGQFTSLLGWLKKEVFPFGRQYSSEELCLKISGEGLNTSYFLEYLHTKYQSIYHLD